MNGQTFKSVRGKLTNEQKKSVRQGRQWVEENRPRLTDQALVRKRELDALIEAMRMLKRERESRGLSLATISRRSGVDKSNLSKLENDPYPNPTLDTLIRIADAIGVRLTIAIADKAA
jgi:DNA-binding phage protein